MFCTSWINRRGGSNLDSGKTTVTDGESTYFGNFGCTGGEWSLLQCPFTRGWYHPNSLSLGETGGPEEPFPSISDHVPMSSCSGVRLP